MDFCLNPSAHIARGIENIILFGENRDHLLTKAISQISSRLLSVTIFPVALAFELLFKRIPKALFTPLIKRPPAKDGESSKFQKRCDKITKFALGILCSPIGLLSPDSVSGFFLKTKKDVSAIRPFGVEEIYGRGGQTIYKPATPEEAQAIVKEAVQNNKKISILGAGMSEGTQTIPQDENTVIIDTRSLNTVKIDPKQNRAVVGAGATWETVQIAANKQGKSVIVKQASDPFSVGGSIGMNCHGWAHLRGAIASTVTSLTIINAEGELQTLCPTDEMFGCFFGTMGYFGLIVSAEIELTDNEHLIELSETIQPEQFHKVYQNSIKTQAIPLFGGRLSLDMRKENPFTQVEMVQYVRDEKSNSGKKIVISDFHPEPKTGTRFERIGLQLVSHLTPYLIKQMLGRFWVSEQQNLQKQRRITRNDALHPPINAFFMLHRSQLHAQWLQEYFIKPENLTEFLQFLGDTLKKNHVRLLNATIRPTPKDTISVLPYADVERYAVVICFHQYKTPQAIQKTRSWIKSVTEYVVKKKDVYYQAYMPYATKEQFISCYGQENIQKMQQLKKKFDPKNVFNNQHTKKYFT